MMYFKKFKDKAKSLVSKSGWITWSKKYQEKKDNENKEKSGLMEERVKRCIPVAQEILTLISSSDPKMGDYDPSWDSCYNELAKKVLEIMLKHNLNFSDKDFIFQLIGQPVEFTKDYVLKGLSISFDLALKKKFGKDYMDLTMEDMDTILKSK